MDGTDGLHLSGDMEGLGLDPLDLYRSIFRCVPQGMVIQDALGNILKANPTAQRILGLSAADLKWRTSEDPRWQAIHKDGSPFPGEDHPAMVALRWSRPVENVFMGVFNPDLGRTVWIEVSAFPLSLPGHAGPTHVFTTFTDVTRQVEAEVTNQLSSQRFLSFFEANASVMLVVDPVAGRILDANEAAARYYGYPRTQMKGIDLGRINMLTPDRIKTERMLAVSEQRNFFLFPHRLASGEVRTVEVYSTPFHDGESVVLLSIIHDITERIRSEKALFDSEAKFTKTFHGSPIAMALSDPATGCILDSNAACQTLFAFEAEDLIGKTLSDLDLVSPEAMAELRRRGSEQGFIHELQVELRLPDGRRLTELVSAETVTVGDRPRLLTTWQDLTERRRAEEEVRRLQNLMRQSQSLTRVGGWEIDLVNDTLYWTEETFRIHDLEPGQFTPTLAGAIAFYAPESIPLIQDAVQAAIDHAQGFDLELALITAKGRRIWVHATGRAVQEQSRTIGVVGAFQDITQSKRDEEERHRLLTQLSHSQKMESLGSLAGGIAHDMNNVLGAILGMASANQDFHPDGSPAYVAFGTIREAAARGGQMVKGLLNFARKTPAEDRVFDANLILREVINLLAHTTLARIALHSDLEPSLWPIRGDANALVNAVMNLCVKAVDAMPLEGTLTLSTRNLPDGWVEIRVEDTGAGMPEEVLARATEPFYTTKATGKGTGLGLASTYSAVKAHHGVLEIRSEPGQGTCVMMRFPREGDEPIAEKEPSAAAPPAASGPMRVLLVDDDDLILKTSRFMLEALGHVVTTAASGEEALRQLDAGLDPAAMILDLNMPGLGGARTLAKVRTAHPYLPVLLATGTTDQTALDLVDADPQVTLLSKPYDLMELQARLLALPRRD